MKPHLRTAAKLKAKRASARASNGYRRVRLQPSGCKPIQETLQAIENADLITLGPGSLFTSVIPNLLVKGIPEAIQASPAIKVYFVNLMWQPGETLSFSASDHVSAIYDHARRRLIDVAVINSKPIPALLKSKYAAQRAMPVENDVSELHAMGLKVVARKLAADGEKVRHDPAMLAETAIHLAGEGRRRRLKLRK